VPEAGIIGVPDVKSPYWVPEVMSKQGILQYIENYFDMKPATFADPWEKYKENLDHPKESVRIAVVGKYTNLLDAYMSHKEAFTHVTGTTGIGVEIVWLDSDKLKESTADLVTVDGILVPGGFGYRGVEGKIRACQFARENQVPFLGICLGFQAAVIEYARNVLGLAGANSTEFDANTKYPVIDLLPEQEGISDMGGTLRLGAKPVTVRKNTIAHSIYASDLISERHRHRYEVNPKFIGDFEQVGMQFSGVDEAGIRMEILELSGRKNFIATQYHSEFKSRPLFPSRVHKYLVEMALEHRKVKTDEGSP